MSRAAREAGPDRRQVFQLLLLVGPAIVHLPAPADEHDRHLVLAAVGRSVRADPGAVVGRLRDGGETPGEGGPVGVEPLAIQLHLGSTPALALVDHS